MSMRQLHVCGYVAACMGFFCLKIKRECLQKMRIAEDQLVIEGESEKGSEGGMALLANRIPWHCCSG